MKLVTVPFSSHGQTITEVPGRNSWATPYRSKTWSCRSFIQTSSSRRPLCKCCFHTVILNVRGTNLEGLSEGIIIVCTLPPDHLYSNLSQCSALQLSGFGSKLPNDLHDSAILDPITFPYITISSTCHWLLWDIQKLTSQVTDSARTSQFDLCAV